MPAHAPLQLLQALAQRLLALAQSLTLALLALLAVLGLLLALAGLALLAGLLPALTLALLSALALLLALPALALLHAALLTVAEGLVAQLLLLARHGVEILHGALHLARHRVRHAVVALRGLEVLHDVAQLLEQALRLGHVAAAHGLFHLLHHAVEIVLGDRPLRLLGVLVVVALLLLALHPLGELAQELVHGLAQLVHEALDLVRAGVAVHGLAQAVLRGAQLPLGITEVAVLDLDRHGPEPVRDLHELGIALRPAQPLGCGPQAHEHAPFLREGVGRDQERVEGDLHPAPVVGVEHQLAALFHERLREGLGEGPLRQGEVDGGAAPLLAGVVLGDERQLHPRPGPGMAGEVDRRLVSASSEEVSGIATGRVGAGTRVRLPVSASPFSTVPSVAVMP
jgi:hypothetical protein